MSSLEKYSCGHGVQVSEFLSSFGCVLRSDALHPRVTLLMLQGPATLLSSVVVPLCIPAAARECSRFSVLLPACAPCLLDCDCHNRGATSCFGCDRKVFRASLAQQPSLDPIVNQSQPGEDPWSASALPLSAGNSEQDTSGSFLLCEVDW